LKTNRIGIKLIKIHPSREKLVFQDYKKERPGFLEILNKVVLIIPVILFLVVAVSLIVRFSGQLSTKDKKALQARVEKENALLSKTSVIVRDAGYTKRSTESGDVYIPSLLVQVMNTDSDARDRLLLYAIFTRRGQPFCSGSISVYHLPPGESREVQIRCLEPTGFGAIAKGLSLMETTAPLTYELFLQAGDVRIKVAEDGLSFKILGPNI
jgi:hypothetical protein